MRAHRYTIDLAWQGNRGSGTSDYRAYGRTHAIRAPGKPDIAGSADAAFRGETDRWNPEELFVAALSACHQLWYLHLCADAGIILTAYADHAEGTMMEDTSGAGRFTRVVLHPHATLAAGTDLAQARALHHAAHEKCFIANSISCVVEIEPEFSTAA